MLRTSDIQRLLSAPMAPRELPKSEQRERLFLDFIKRNGAVTGRQLSEHYGIHLTGCNKVLRDLADRGYLDVREESKANKNEQGIVTTTRYKMYTLKS